MKRKSALPQPYLDLLQEYKHEEKKTRLEQSVSPDPHDPAVERFIDPQPPGQVAAESSSEDEWDEVELEDQNVDFNDVEISFEKPKSTKKADTISRSLRLQVHASCFALLLAHTRIRNFWTQDRQLKMELRSLMPFVILQQLVPPPHLSGTLKTKSLLQGLRQAANWWNQKFKVTTSGLYMVSWDAFNDKSRPVEGPVTKERFIESICKTQGSLDILGQGFCALLRAHGFECRLVCSLQPPDFMSHGAAKKSGQKASIYPLYWTEVWDENESQWITTDPVTGTAEIIRRGAPLEPPQSDVYNMLRYCIAWFHNGSARDVTRRYSSRYAARVRKKRLDYLPSYAKIYNTLMARFAVKTFGSRDIKELKSLYRREQSEGIPSRVADFIGHPLYCLEHQLKKTEILEPKVPTGTLALKGEVIPIYSRKNVKTCRSAQTWYRQGRVISAGEQPKKHRSKRDKLTGVEERVSLYTWDQTEWFKPQPVVDGIVPKSEYKTVDLFSRNMLPPGSIHIKNPMAQKAAKFLGIDYANAVVSISFKSREGPKSKYNGIVVAKEFGPAVDEVMRGLAKQHKMDQKRQHKAKMLYLWKQFMVAAQIRRRVDGNDPGFEIKDTEPWPVNTDNTISGITSDTTDSSSEEEEEEVLPLEVQVKDELETPSVPVDDHSAEKPPVNQPIQIPMGEILHNSTTHEKRSPTHSDFEDDEEYPDMMLDGLNESDFDN